MYVVRKTYENRILDNYLRLGKGNLGPGSLSPSWLRVFMEDGLMPDEAYTGISYDSPTHNHRELQAYIDAAAAVPVSLKKMSKESEEVAGAILDVYLGEVPSSFNFKGATYNPKTFAQACGLNMDDLYTLPHSPIFPSITEALVEVPDTMGDERFHNVRWMN
jgi:bleomycin hydrolase